MATFTVTTAADVVNASDGMLSLREAVAQANATTTADTIVFAAPLEGSTLVLTGGEIDITRGLTIDGDQNNDGIVVEIQAAREPVPYGYYGSRHFRAINNDTTLDIEVNLSGLAISGGYSDASGGSIWLYNSNLNIDACSFNDNWTGNRGGAIFAGYGANLKITNSVFTSNSADYGGAITAHGANLEISNTLFEGNSADYTGGALNTSGQLTLQNSTIRNNTCAENYYGSGGGGIAFYGTAHILNSSITDNESRFSGGGIKFFGGSLTLVDTTIADNAAGESFGGKGGGIYAEDGAVMLRNSTVTGNQAGFGGVSSGGGLFPPDPGTTFDIANSIIVGNKVQGTAVEGADLNGTISVSNGHNIFGSEVLGDIAGDRENVAANTIFASIDPLTGGGLVNTAGIVPLRASVTNPAIGGADRFAIGSTDQIGTARPTPTGTNPDIGAAESGFRHSTVSSDNNDTLTGTAAANTLNGKGGHDFLKGLGGADTLNGGDGGDFLEGGSGNDKLNGNAGIDIANYGDSATAVTVDLRGDSATDKDTAKRGSETDTLTGIEGAIAAGGNDVFYGDNAANWFQGGGGKDTFTGGGGRDTYDYNQVSASPVGSGRDVITDFDHLVDRIDLMGIDGDTAMAGNQALRWVGTAALTGPGEVGYFTSGGNTIVRISNDADAAAEGEIQLTGIKTLTANDFYL